MFIVTKKIDSENISKLCRTCLREDSDKMVYLFVGPPSSSLAAKLRSLSCLEVWQGDGLPEKMCDRCVTRAESALLYREQCRAADRALRQAALKVAGVTSYTTVSGCKLFQENQGFVPVQNCQKTLKCVVCGAVFMNYQDLLTHNKIHLSFYPENSTPFHMLEPHMNYSNLVPHSQNYVTNPETEHQNLVRPKVLHSLPANNANVEKNHWHCSLFNHSVPNKLQTTNHNYLQANDNADVSCDEEHIEITDPIIFNRETESCENSGRGLSYSRQSLNEDENLDGHHFVGTVNLDENLRDNNNQLLMQENQNLCSNTSESNRVPCSIKIKDKKYKCEQCGKSFALKSKLRCHMIVHSEYKPFQCEKCEKAYASKSKLNAHMRLHSRTNVYQCRICDKTFSYPSYLKEHSNVHKIKPVGTEITKNYECSICGKKFQVERNLTVHLRLHSGKNVLNCEFCNKKFSKRYNLKVHLKTVHQETKMHRCEFCEKCFAQRSNLVEHLRIHTGAKPYACKSCGKRFAQTSHLKSHMVTHEITRLHQCRICGKRFKLASHLKRHMNLHTGSKVYKCDQCDQMFSQAFSLKRHSKKHIESC